MTSSPWASNNSAVALPIPDAAPVTTMVRVMSVVFPKSVDVMCFALCALLMCFKPSRQPYQRLAHTLAKDARVAASPPCSLPTMPLSVGSRLSVCCCVLEDSLGLERCQDENSVKKAEESVLDKIDS